MRKPEPQPEVSIENVLFATDFSPATEAALSYASAIADRYRSRLYVAHVINLESFDLLESESARLLVKQARDEAERKIAQLVAPLGLPRDRYEVRIVEGAISEALVDLIQRNHIDLAVLGTHGRRAFKKLLLGSVAEEVFRMAPCPVLTVGPKIAPLSAGRDLRHILYPVEFAPDRSNAAPYVVSLADRYGATLTVMNIQEDMAEPAEGGMEPIEHWIRDHVPEGSDLRNRVRAQSGSGPVADTILDFAAKAEVDLIVMAVSELDPVLAAHVPGADTAHQLVSRAPCPVLTIR